MDDTDVPREPGPAEPEEPAPIPVSPTATVRRRGFRSADWQAFLHNRFILGGLGVVVILLLVMVVLVAFGEGDGSPSGSLAAREEKTPESEATQVPRRGLTGSVRVTTTMRNGPGTNYAILGTIRKGTVVQIVGRNDDETWLQVIHPPGSQIRGWVSASVIKVSGDVSRLAIARPGSGPDVYVPTPDTWVPAEPEVPEPEVPPAEPTYAPPPEEPTFAPPPPEPTATPPPPPPTDTPPPPPTQQPTLPPPTQPPGTPST